VGMRYFLLMIAVVALVGCGKMESPEPQANASVTPKADVKTPEPTKAAPNKLIANPIVEKAIRDDAGEAGSRQQRPCRT
jgi:hypothetical protein